MRREIVDWSTARLLRGPAALLIAVLSILATAPAVWAQGAEVTFTDIGLQAGFQDRLDHGRALVAADFNLDGWVDFFVGNPTDGVVAADDSFILWNNGPDGDGQFTFTKGQVLIKGDITFTASAADFDNDGDQDLYVGIGGQEGIGLDHLYRNQGGIFTDISESARVQGPWDPKGRPVPVATSSGTWADYDNDGDLDLFVSVRHQKETLPLPGDLGQRDTLFRNNGDATFTDVTVAAGINGILGSMTAAWGDFDNDGWMDLFVPNHYPTGFQLYRNNQDGTFTELPLSEVALDWGDRAGWATSVADFNEDGRLDAMTFARGKPPSPDSHALLINRGDWRFTNDAKAAGLVPPGEAVPTVMGTAVGDYNNDGYPDIFMGDGGPLFSEKDHLFVNLGDANRGSLQFADVSSLIDFAAPDDPNCVPPARPVGQHPTYVDHFDMLPGTADDPSSFDTAELPADNANPCLPVYPYRGHAAIFVDFDKDGDLDLFAVKGGTVIIAPDVSSTEPNRLFRNDGGNSKNWLFIELDGNVSNRDAYGARIEVTSSQGGANRVTQVQQVQGNTGFSASGPREVHFGLGDADTVEEIVVTWPSGIVTRLTDVAPNQRLRLGEDLISKSDFNDGQSDGWVPVSGHWGAMGGYYGQAGSGRAMSLNQAAAMADYTVVAKVTYMGGQQQLGVVGRVGNDGKDYYAVMLMHDQARLYRSVDDQLTPIGAAIPIEPMTPGRSYIVRLGFNGGWVSMSVDRSAEVQVIDPWLTSGTFGLVTNNTSAKFDNIAVY